MLGYLLRTAPVVLSARAGAHGQRVSRLRRRVWPSAVDLNRHMNQSVYAQVMELGRVDWLIRSGAWSRWQAQRINPVVAEQNIVYRRELRPFASYTVDTRVTGLEGRLLLFEHHLILGTGDEGDKVAARGTVKLIFVGPDGVLPADALPRLCEGLIHAPLPVSGWCVGGAPASG